MTTLFVIVVSTVILCAVLCPVVEWCDKVKKEMREDNRDGAE